MQETVHEPLPMADDVVAAAVHGSFCPKMCNHVCPIFTVTGRDDAMPWSLHREVADLANGRQAATDVGHRLDACNGCLACQTACAFDQDVPAQVVAARTAVMAAGVDRDPAIRASDDVADGRSPYATPPLRVDGGTGGTDTVIVTGCRTTDDEARAALAIAAAAGVDASLAVPSGCCGRVLRDLGLPEGAGVRGRALAPALAGAATVVVLEEQCASEVAEHTDADVVDIATWLAGLVGDLAVRTDDATVTWHDPPLLARRLGVVDQPREVLARVGASLVEPEGTGRATNSAGSGLGFDLLAPDDALRVAVARRSQLEATGGVIVSTGPEVAMLRATGADVWSLVEFVAARIHGQEA